LTYPSPDVSIFRGVPVRIKQLNPRASYQQNPVKMAQSRNPRILEMRRAEFFHFLNLRKNQKPGKRDQVKVPKPIRKQK
jgi:hypothetical protein